ncbi:transcription factor with AP2 domain(s), putative [Plasmodium ovale wallikeri]|uniref:Transcription factor with AP2 domain(S), putative n=1 Tax=Plasmodium ovale wallikeri TaxID=864142 RepID=A0A1A8ZI53_PLAOA|nr:transcription factor with AP2 domain(s), putative [Plasmodium ovale wallikeri]
MIDCTENKAVIERQEDNGMSIIGKRQIYENMPRVNEADIYESAEDNTKNKGVWYNARTKCWLACVKGSGRHLRVFSVKKHGFKKAKMLAVECKNATFYNYNNNAGTIVNRGINAAAGGAVTGAVGDAVAGTMGASINSSIINSGTGNSTDVNCLTSDGVITNGVTVNGAITNNGTTNGVPARLHTRSQKNFPHAEAQSEPYKNTRGYANNEAKEVKGQKINKSNGAQIAVEVPVDSSQLVMANGATNGVIMKSENANGNVNGIGLGIESSDPSNRNRRYNTRRCSYKPPEETHKKDDVMTNMAVVNRTSASNTGVNRASGNHYHGNSRNSRSNNLLNDVTKSPKGEKASQNTTPEFSSSKIGKRANSPSNYQTDSKKRKKQIKDKFSCLVKQDKIGINSNEAISGSANITNCKNALCKGGNTKAANFRGANTKVANFRGGSYSRGGNYSGGNYTGGNYTGENYNGESYNGGGSYNRNSYDNTYSQGRNRSQNNQINRMKNKSQINNSNCIITDKDFQVDSPVQTNEEDYFMKPLSYEYSENIEKGKNCKYSENECNVIYTNDYYTDNTNQNREEYKTNFIDLTREALALILQDLKKNVIPKIPVGLEKRERYTNSLRLCLRSAKLTNHIDELEPYLELFSECIKNSKLPSHMELKDQLFYLDKL